MKQLLVCLGVAVSFACPLRSFAAETVIINGHMPRWVTYAEVIGKGKNQVIYYHTNITVIGSHIPVMLRESQGQVEVVGCGPVNGRIYGSDTGRGGNDVSNQLHWTEPSVTIR